MWAGWCQVQKAEEIFTCFDEDKDGYLNYQESVACNQGCTGVDVIGHELQCSSL